MFYNPLFRADYFGLSNLHIIYNIYADVLCSIFHFDALFLLFALSSVSMYMTDSKPSLVAKLVAVGLAFLVALCVWAFRHQKVNKKRGSTRLEALPLLFLYAVRSSTSFSTAE